MVQGRAIVFRGGFHIGHAATQSGMQGNITKPSVRGRHTHLRQVAASNKPHAGDIGGAEELGAGFANFIICRTGGKKSQQFQYIGLFVAQPRR